MMRKLALFAVWLAAAFAAAPALAQPQFPELTGRVVDNAEIIPPEVEAALNAKLEAFEAQSQRQVVVATIPDLQGYDIADYGYQLGRAWGLGDQERNDGALLIVAPKDRKVRIEVGYGLEPVLTDGLSALIVQQQILPLFKAGDMPRGIVAGTDAIIQQLQLPEEEARAIAAQAQQQQPESEGNFPIGAVVWMLFIAFFIIMPIIARAAGGRKYRGRGRRGSGVAGAVGEVLLWTAVNAALNSRSGGGSSGGGFGGFGGGGGGGFSGGGGSFGGGGASGGW